MAEKWILEDNLELQGMEIMEMNGSLLMELLEEESHVQEEEGEDEMLETVIRSLEAELHPCTRASRGSVDSSGSCDSSALPVHDDEWMDMEISSLCPPSDDMGNWYYNMYSTSMDDAIIGMTEFEDIRDYSEIYSSEEYVYSSLWQETYDWRS